MLFWKMNCTAAFKSEPCGGDDDREVGLGQREGLEDGQRGARGLTVARAVPTRWSV